ncbi:MAG: estA [Proteobacteria bacterium]|nr:estA [Pseudomonadota bacterium]
MPALLPAIEIETAANPQFAVIWLHGLGADGSDFAPIVPHLGLAKSLAVRFIFPHAPAIPVTCNGGYVMPAWYDITSIDGSKRGVDEAGILVSSAAIRALIARQNELGIPCSQIVLAGFSQGGALAYSVGLSHRQTLAGIIALSAYLPAPALLAEETLGANRQTPIFAGHGSDDDVVPLALGRQAHDFLQGQAYRIAWHEYPMPHSVCPEEIADIGRWLNERLKIAV